MPTLVIPLPDVRLKLNRTIGSHWSVTKRIKDGYRLEVMAAANRQRAEWYGREWAYPIELHITAFLGKNQRADAGDVPGWCKAGIDQLVRMGVWKDDGSKYINPMVPQVARDWNAPRLVLEWR